MTFSFNTLMLLSGGVVAFGVVEPEREESILYLGFVPFIFVFLAPTIYMLSFYTTHGMVLLLATFVVWGARARASSTLHTPRGVARAALEPFTHVCTAQAGTASRRSCSERTFSRSASVTTCSCASPPTRCPISTPHARHSSRYPVTCDIVPPVSQDIVSKNLSVLIVVAFALAEDTVC